MNGGVDHGQFEVSQHLNYRDYDLTIQRELRCAFDVGRVGAPGTA